MLEGQQVFYQLLKDWQDNYELLKQGLFKC